LSHDILALAGPALAKRQVLFDFIEELAKRLGSLLIPSLFGVARDNPLAF
jgi:hypothetical protein